jgi:hypothetical protein
MASPLKFHLKTGGCKIRIPYVNRTGDPTLVTCKVCRNIIDKKPQGGRAKKSGGQNSITAKVTDAAFANWQKLTKKNCGSQTVSDYLESLDPAE